MNWLAALATAAAVYLAVGAATRTLPELRPRRRRAGRLDAWLAQAGVDLTPRQFVVSSVLAGVVVAALTVAVTGTPSVAVVPAVATGSLPRAWLSRRRAARLRELQEAWPDGLRDLTASITAGLSLHQALTSLSERGPEPLRAAFSRYPVLARILGVVPALEVVKEELADPTSDRVIEVLALAHERGGHLLGDILRDLAETTAKDVRTAEEVATDTLEQRINARAVFVLPWAVLLVLTARPGHFRDFYRSSGGMLVVVVAAIASLLGMWLVGRLGREPAEERVFGRGR